MITPASSAATAVNVSDYNSSKRLLADANKRLLDGHTIVRCKKPEGEAGSTASAGGYGFASGGAEQANGNAGDLNQGVEHLSVSAPAQPDSLW